MAEGKKSIIVYADWISIFEKLSDNEAGKLIKHFFRYVNDLNPEPPDRITELTFEPLKCTLKRDLVRYESIRQKRSEAGKSGGRPKNEGDSNDLEEKQNKAKKANAFFVKQTKAKKADSVSVSDSVSDSNISLADSNLFRKPNIPSFDKVYEQFVFKHGTKEMAQAFFDKYQALDWFLNGSPITNFANLIPSFIRNWQENDKRKSTNKQKEPETKGITLKVL